jgi:hypothetical protein
VTAFLEDADTKRLLVFTDGKDLSAVRRAGAGARRRHKKLDPPYA